MPTKGKKDPQKYRVEISLCLELEAETPEQAVNIAHQHYKADEKATRCHVAAYRLFPGEAKRENW